MPFTQLQILITSGGGQQNVVIGLPPAVAADPFDAAPGQTAQQKPGVAGVVEAISRVGFWDSAGQTFYPPTAILKITPI